MQEKMMNTDSNDTGTIYEIRVQGELDRSWESYFNELALTFARPGGLPVTTLTGRVADQPALRGVLCKLWDLNLTLISVQRIAVDSAKEQKND